MKTFKDWVLFLCVVGLVICFIYIHTLSLRIDLLARSGLPARSTTTNCTK